MSLILDYKYSVYNNKNILKKSFIKLKIIGFCKLVSIMSNLILYQIVEIKYLFFLSILI